LEGATVINDGDDDGHANRASDHVSFFANPARQTRPLRRSKRPLMETRSLPAGAMRFRHGDGNIIAPSNIDEDWSTGTLEIHQTTLPDGRSENFIK
jgi:hypothetical protein